MATDLSIEAQPPPRRTVVRLTLSPSENGDGLCARWESDGEDGLFAGPPADVARAVGALVLRLAGLPQPDDAPEDTRPVKPLSGGQTCSSS